MENPARKIRTTPRRLFGSAALTAIVLTPAGVALSLASAPPSDYRGQEIYRAAVPGYCDFYAVRELNDNCIEISQDRRNILIWGDSHARAIAAGLMEILEKDLSISQITTSACRPAVSNLDPDETEPYVTNSGQITFGPACKKSNAFASELLRNQAFDAVILVMAKDHLETLSAELESFLQQNGVGRVVVIGPSPQWRDSLPRIANSAIAETRVKEMIREEIFDVDVALKERYSGSDFVEFISLLDVLCESSDRECRYIVPGAEVEDRFITWDYGHFSVSGSQYVSRLIQPLFTLYTEQFE